MERFQSKLQQGVSPVVAPHVYSPIPSSVEHLTGRQQVAFLFAVFDMTRLGFEPTISQSCGNSQTAILHKVKGLEAIKDKTTAQNIYHYQWIIQQARNNVGLQKNNKKATK